MSVLICYDGSQSAKDALAVARETLTGDITLLHVWSRPESVITDAFGVRQRFGGPSTAELERLAVERALQIAEEGRQLAQELGLEVELRLEPDESTIWRTILDTAEDEDAAVIVIGTHGRTVVQSALLGSVSSAVVHHSERPVLVVPARTRSESEHRGASTAARARSNGTLE